MRNQHGNQIQISAEYLMKSLFLSVQLQTQHQFVQCLKVNKWKNNSILETRMNLRLRWNSDAIFIYSFVCVCGRNITIFWRLFMSQYLSSTSEKTEALDGLTKKFWNWFLVRLYQSYGHQIHRYNMSSAALHIGIGSVNWRIRRDVYELGTDHLFVSHASRHPAKASQWNHGKYCQICKSIFLFDDLKNGLTFSAING